MRFKQNNQRTVGINKPLMKKDKDTRQGDVTLHTKKLETYNGLCFDTSY
jgi:hypothetical protein